MRVLVTVTFCSVFSKTKHLPAVLGTTSALSCKDRVRINISGTMEAGKETCRTGYRWRCQIILGRQTYFHNNASCTFATDFHVEKDPWVRHSSGCKAGNSWNQCQNLRSNLPSALPEQEGRARAKRWRFASLQPSSVAEDEGRKNGANGISECPMNNLV